MHVYQLRPKAKIEWKGQQLFRGDIIYGDDAREIEAPEHRHLHHHLVRLPESAFPHLFAESAPSTPSGVDTALGDALEQE